MDAVTANEPRIADSPTGRATPPASTRAIDPKNARRAKSHEDIAGALNLSGAMGKRQRIGLPGCDVLGARMVDKDVAGKDGKKEKAKPLENERTSSERRFCRNEEGGCHEGETADEAENGKRHADTDCKSNCAWHELSVADA